MKFKNKINKVNFSALVVLIALIILGVSFNVNAETNTWEQYGSQLLMANETESAFTFNPNTGEPYIIYSDGSVSNPASLSVKKFDGSSWEYVGAAGISSGVGLYPSIAFNPIDNQPYIAFSHSDGSGINVSRYDGSTWVSVGTVNASGDYPSIAFDSDNGYLYLAYEKNITEEVKVQRYTGSSWQDVGSTVSDGTGTYTSIAFDSLSDTVYVGYRDDVDASFTTTVKKYDFSGDWETVGVRGLSGIASRDEFSKNQKMYVDPLTGDPYIMYDYGNDPVHGVLAKFDGINWVDVGGGFYYYSTYSTSSVSQLAFSPLNDIYITHRGESSSNINKITVEKLNSEETGWDLVGSADFIESSSHAASLVFNPLTSEPYISVSEGGFLGIYLMRFSSNEVESPITSPSSGTYSSSQSVTLSTTTDGASIYYTTNGSTPTTASTLYSGPITISEDTTLKAVAVKDGMADSDLMTEEYVINIPQVVTPASSPAGGTYDSSQSVTLSTTTDGASIYYTTDGSTPTTGLTLYSSPITISEDTTLKAVAVKDGMADSELTTEEYVINTNEDPEEPEEDLSSPVYRFYSPTGKSHFFTTSESEKSRIIANYSNNWNYEGIAYYAYSSSDTGLAPVYRFYSPTGKSHFFTTSESEKSRIISNYSADWNYEGVAWYVPEN